MSIVWNTQTTEMKWTKPVNHAQALFGEPTRHIVNQGMDRARTALTLHK